MSESQIYQRALLRQIAVLERCLVLSIKNHAEMMKRVANAIQEPVERTE